MMESAVLAQSRPGWSTTDSTSSSGCASESGGPSKRAGGTVRGPSRGSAKVRVLVVYGDEYRSYREAIARGIEMLRPHAEVAVAGLTTLETEVERIAPDLVICSEPKAGGVRRSALIWVELPSDPDQPAAICFKGHRSRTPHLTFEDLLSIVDAAQELSWLGAVGESTSWCSGTRSEAT